MGTTDLTEPLLQYHLIEPLIVTTEQKGNQIVATFQCPVTNEQVTARATIERSGIADFALGQTKRHLPWIIHRAVWRGFMQKLGYSFLGELAGGVAGSMAGASVQKKISEASITFSAEDKETAVLNAFRKVAHRFVWNAPHKRWLSAKTTTQLATDFQKQLRKAPITLKYDQLLLARLLVQLINLDREIAESEKRMLTLFIDPNVGSLEQLLAKPPLSAAELAEASAPDTMLMLAWTLALADENLNPLESDFLQQIATQSALSEYKSSKMKRFAQLFLLDQAVEHLYWEGSLTNQNKIDLFHLGQRIGVQKGTVEKVIVQYQKRNGLF